MHAYPTLISEEVKQVAFLFTGMTLNTMLYLLRKGIHQKNLFKNLLILMTVLLNENTVIRYTLLRI